MQPGGIKFTVTATAEGKADSVSETFVYERNLDAVGQIVYNAENQSFYWSAVNSASKYMVTVTVGGKTYTVDNGSATTFSVKNLSGNITLEVVPVTKGYNSPEASAVTYNKTSLATPDGLCFSGNTLSWNQVEGATGYLVKVNTQSYAVDTNSMDLSGLQLQSGTTYDISVMAKGAEDSLFCDVMTVKYLANIDHVSYKNNTLTWTPVLGVSNYEIRVNGEVVQTVSGTNTAKIRLTKAGTNLIEVRYTDLSGSDWTATEAYAYTVTYDSRSLDGIVVEYVAIGDTMTLPTEFNMDGYEFNGWYNSPDGAAGNGAAVTDNQFIGTGAIVLYGSWRAKSFNIEYVGVPETVTNIANGETLSVVYKTAYKLPIPEDPDAEGDFVGWFTGPGGDGEALTDSQGNSLGLYEFARDTKAYPYFDTGVLEFILQEDETYAVKAGPSAKSVVNVRVPEYYKGIPVTTILENAFVGMDNMQKLEIPATIRHIGVGAIPNYEVMKEINVYTNTIQQNYEVFYSSHDGALLRHDMGTVYLEVFPRGKTGEYVVPDYVNVIRDKVFRYVSITKLTIGTGVAEIMQNAFYQCGNLEVLEFKTGGTSALNIDPNAFYRTTNMKTLRLPARLATMNLQSLDAFAKLTTLEIEEGGNTYSTLDNMICNALGDTILYVPKTIAGEYTIPVGIRAIGDNAFANRPMLTKLSIPNYVNTIGMNAFMNATGLTEVVIEGDRNANLLISTEAFAGCSNVITVTVKGNGKGTLDKGATTFGDYSFASLSKLRNVVVEAGARVIVSDYAFSGDAKLANLDIADAAEIGYIGKNAFANCSDLSKLVIHATTETISDGAFANCGNLQEVTFAPNGKDITFGSNVFGGCSKLYKINLPATLNSFDGSVFAGCVALKQIEVDPASKNLVSYNGALYKKDYSEILFYPMALDGDLTKLHPDLKKIGDTVFQGNSKITKAIIGKNVVSIGDYAFDNCYNMTEVVFDGGISAMTIGNAAFRNCTKLTAVTLPTSTSAIGASAFENTGLTAFTIPSGVSVLYNNVLKNTKITTIHIHANVEAIGDGAFANSLLETITFASGSKPLMLGTLDNADSKNGVFYGTKIATFDVPDRVTLLGAHLFNGQTSLKTLNISSNSQLIIIGEYAFANCSGLTVATLGPKVETIEACAFYGSKITSITIPTSVTTLAYRAFYNAPLSTVTFELGGKEDLVMESQVFYGSKFKEITLPARLMVAYDKVDWSSKTSFKNFNEQFTNNTSLKTVNVEEGGLYFASIDGVVYELNSEGVADTLLYCPPAKNGSLVIPKEVRKVENRAFVGTKLTNISFEEYAEGDENYGKPLLELGNTTATHDTKFPGNNYAVFAPSVKTTISLPSHLKTVGIQCFYGLKKNTVITFNQAAHVTSVEDGAFNGCAYITEVNFPAVDNMGAGVFYDCAALTAVTFGKDSKFAELPSHTFMNCTSLTTFEVPACVTNIGQGAFRNCSALTSVTFPADSRLQFITSSAFMDSGLVEFEMPNTVVSVSGPIFSGCENLKRIKLSKNLSNLGNTEFSTMFSDLVSLETVEIDAGSPYFKVIDGVLYDAAETILYFYPQHKDPTGFTIPATVTTLGMYSLHNFPGSELILPDGLEVIQNYALYGAKIQHLVIPRNVKQIDNYALMQMKELETLVFAENSKLQKLGMSAFGGCSKLKSVNLPDSVTSMDRSVFSGCTALESMILPAGLTNLPINTFQNCMSLKSVTLQEGLRFIEGTVFSDENNGRYQTLEEITIPSTVKEIGVRAFFHHGGLKHVYFAEGSQLETIGYAAFQGCTGLESLTLPASLKDLATLKTTVNGEVVDAAFTFAGCTSLQYLDMSACEQIIILPIKALDGCYKLETLLLPCALETIENYGCYGLASLKSITIPATVSSIGGYAFDGCVSLQMVIFADDSPLTSLGVDEVRADQPDFGVNIFANTPSLRTVVLPKGLITVGVGCFEGSGLVTMDLPSTVRVIAERAFKNCDNLIMADFSAELLYLGDEAFYGCDALEYADLRFGLEYLGAYAFAYCPQLKRAYIPASVNSIAGNPYLGCSGVETFELDADSADFVVKDGVLYNKEMTTLLYYPANLTAETFEFPETVRQIGNGAFAGAKLKHFVVPENVLEIPDRAFDSADIETVTIHSGVQNIGDYAFANCHNLNNVLMPYTVRTIGDYVFANCTSLTNFAFEEIPSTVTPATIGTHMFDGCVGITEMIIHDRMTSIPDYMFANTSITSVVLPAHITDFTTEGVFYGCDKLQSVVFEEKAYAEKTTLGIAYFQGCSSLTQIDIPYNVNLGNGYTFAFCTSLEKVNLYTKSKGPGLGGQYCWYNCGNLYEFNIMRVVTMTYDSNGKVTGYNQLERTTRNALVTPYCFAGCYKLDVMSLHTFAVNQTYMENCFAGFPNPVLVLKGELMFWQTDPEKVSLANAPDLKQVWLNPTKLHMEPATFSNVASEMTIIFYTLTYDEVMALNATKSAGWYTEASSLVTFYFKDTIPEDMEWPENAT